MPAFASRPAIGTELVTWWNQQLRLNGSGSIVDWGGEHESFHGRGAARGGDHCERSRQGDPAERIPVIGRSFNDGMLAPVPNRQSDSGPPQQRKGMGYEWENGMRISYRELDPEEGYEPAMASPPPPPPKRHRRDGEQGSRLQDPKALDRSPEQAAVEPSSPEQWRWIGGAPDDEEVRTCQVQIMLSSPC